MSIFRELVFPYLCGMVGGAAILDIAHRHGSFGVSGFLIVTFTALVSLALVSLLIDTKRIRFALDTIEGSLDDIQRTTGETQMKARTE